MGAIDLAIDSVAIFETNTSIDSAEFKRITLMSILTGLEVV
jgi:hypothetical protein